MIKHAKHLCMVLGQYWRLLLAVIIFCVLFYSAWRLRGYINPQWIDDERSLFQQEVVFKAINNKKWIIPLAQTTNFKWHAVCEVWVGHLKNMEEGNITPEVYDIQQTLGVENLKFDHPDKFEEGEYPLLVYATPEGPYISSPVWIRFSKSFQKFSWGKEYKKRLGGAGYEITISPPNQDDSFWEKPCYLPHEIQLRIKPGY